MNDRVASFIDGSKHGASLEEVSQKMGLVLEECTVMIIFAEEGYAFQIYPNRRNPALDYIYKKSHFRI